MNRKLAINMFNTSVSRGKKLYSQKCNCLPKEDRKEYKKALDWIQKAIKEC